MLFMRCVFESRLNKLEMYPFPGLKVINIRGSSLLALDLIIIGNFVAKLDEKNRLLEMALRDYPLDRTGLLGLIPCIPLIRSVARSLLHYAHVVPCKGVSFPSCFFVQGDYVGFNTGNGEKLSYSQAEPGQASCLPVA